MTKEILMATKRIVVFTILGLLVSVTSWSIDSDAVARATARVSKGDAALTRGNYSEAEKHFRKATECAPEVPTAYLGLGAALVGQKRYVEALDALAKAEQRYIEYEQMSQESGRRAIDSMQNTEEKLETFMGTYKVFQRGPSNQILSQRQVTEMNITDASVIPAHLYYLQGVAFLRTDQKVGGIERLERCISINDNHGLAHYNLAVALYSLEHFPEAGRHIEAAIDAGIEPPPELIAEIETRSRERSLADASKPPSGEQVP
jgi:tetratricopeptide (TPR) repeat protein